MRSRLAVLFTANNLQLPTAAQLIRQPLLRAGDRVLVLVKQLLDPQRHLDVAFAIHTLSGAILLRREHRKLRFPVTQHVRLHAREFADFADLEEELFGYGYSGTTHSIKLPERKLLKLAFAIGESGGRCESRNVSNGELPAARRRRRHVTRVSFDVSILTLSSTYLKLFLKGNSLTTHRRGT